MDKKPKEKSKSNTLLNMLDSLYEGGLPKQGMEAPAPVPGQPPVAAPGGTADILQQLQMMPLPKRPKEEEEEEDVLTDEVAMPSIPIVGPN